MISYSDLSCVSDDDQSKRTGSSFQKEKNGSANDVLWERLLWNASAKVA